MAKTIITRTNLFIIRICHIATFTYLFVLQKQESISSASLLALKLCQTMYNVITYIVVDYVYTYLL